MRSSFQSPLKGGQGIGRFSDITGDPDPAGTSYDLQDAQTFTVGMAGRLALIRVPIFNIEGATQGVELSIRSVSAGVPDSDDLAVLGSVVVPAPAVSTSWSTDPADWVEFDVTGLGIDVDVGEVLAFSVRSADTNGYLLQPEINTGYAEGEGFRRNRATTSTWSCMFDFGFETYVGL